MTVNEKEKAVISITDYFPQKLKSIITSFPKRVLMGISEIRLRTGRPLQLTLDGENVFISQKGQICYLSQQGLYTVNRQEMDEIFNRMCEHSVYAYTEQIKQGYISLKNGCRVGLAASAVYENGELHNFCSVSSMNIRIATEYIGCARGITQYLKESVLIFGPPSAGKTTLLRDAVRTVSSGDGTHRRRVAVVDTRGEIAAVNQGVPDNDVGPLTDVITGCEKAKGIEIALRTLNPEVIAFDEIGNIAESQEVIRCFNSGTDVFLTLHAGSVDELLKREEQLGIFKTGAIKYAVFKSKPTDEPTVFCVERVNGEIQLRNAVRVPSFA